ncbi:hypothetical protein C7H84_19285 [Burkholderia sp. Nafp2/4-1b]|nr:hypothetical protein C7H84_19285 [Burkholderia sp. Nafp2/4-1b]
MRGARRQATTGTATQSGLTAAPAVPADDLPGDAATLPAIRADPIHPPGRRDLERRGRHAAPLDTPFSTTIVTSEECDARRPYKPSDVFAIRALRASARPNPPRRRLTRPNRPRLLTPVPASGARSAGTEGPTPPKARHFSGPEKQNGGAASFEARSAVSRRTVRRS